MITKDDAVLVYSSMIGKRLPIWKDEILNKIEIESVSDIAKNLIDFGGCLIHTLIISVFLKPPI